MKTLPIRWRLAIWYLAVLALTLAIFSFLAFEGMGRSMRAAVDDELRDRVLGFQRLLSSEDEHDYELEILQHGGAADIIQLATIDGRQIYRSPTVEALNFTIPRVEPGEARYDTIVTRERPYRVLTENLQIGSERYRLQFAVSLASYQEARNRFAWMLVVLIPVLLLVASAGGYWVSRRALAPVDRITAEARAISAHRLSNRLPVPATDDELQRLSETLNAMLARLESSFNRITQFTADASHELRAPLALIRTTAEVCRRRQRSEAEYQRALDRILAEIYKTTKLVEDLLTLARADTASDALARTPVDLTEIVKDACESGNIIAQDKQLAFSVDIGTEPIPINGDRTALLRLFTLLIDNATKYTPSGGNVAVKLSRVDSVAIATVDDTGIGIADQDLPHIFERFYRTDKARSRSEPGCGLGLSIGQWIAEAHGGSIKCSSSVSKGSTFQVRLPLANS